jgi:hypothetical protein
VAGKDLVEGLQLLQAEAYLDTLLLRTLDLAAQLGGKVARPGLPSLRREVSKNGDLSVRHRQVDPQVISAAQLEKVHAPVMREARRVSCQLLAGVAMAERTSIIEEGERNQIVPKHSAFDANQRKDTD